MQLPHEHLRCGFKDQLPERGFKSPRRNCDNQPEEEACETHVL
jgi:hypothetical protein